MANYFLTYLTTAQTGVGVTDNIATLSAFTNEISNGTVAVGDLPNNNYIIRSAAVSYTHLTLPTTWSV